MFCRFFLLLALFFLQSCCTTSHYSINSYKQTNNEIQRTYKLSRADLILSYDLARVDDTNCIYSKVLGLVANEKAYAQKYLQKFKSRYKSQNHLTKEAKKKIVKICDLLKNLHGKYRLLSRKNEHYVQRLSKTDLAKVDLRSELAKLDKIISHIPLMLPSYKAYVSSDYGNRMHPIKRRYIFHCGTDLVSRHKAPLYASAEGRISFVGSQNGYGMVVEIDHGNGIKTKYAHLSKSFVSKGQRVIRSQVVGLQGKTGHARGEHLHFEVHLAGKHVNPYDFIGHNYDCN